MDEMERPDERFASAGPVGEREDSDAQDARRQIDFIARDYDEFARRFPRVDVAALDADGVFRRFCGSRYGKEPLADLYEDYLAVVSAVYETAMARIGSKSARATGSGRGSGGEALTAAQQRALDEWNRANPGMKMTAKEFLSR
ncbi:MAG: hypothetical protein IKQ10_05465 [Oscillospiraceae bacterium]|nr:hypothetical protein [Oscillospiraceae bacterium]